MEKLYQAFQQSIMSGNSDAAMPAIKTHDRLSAADQLGIYQHGYRVRLINAIASDYPALQAYLGASVFEKLAQGYAATHPSQSYNLDRYPHGFAGYVANQNADAFAAELATLECAIATVFMGKESTPLDASVFEGLSPEAFGQVHLPLRPASKLLCLTHPVSQWLDEQRASGQLPAAPAQQASYIYVYRHPYDVQRIVLDEAAFRLLSALGQGMNVGQALEHMSQDYPLLMEQVATNLQGWFAKWLADGFFAAARSR